ncbi:MAG: tripartite tricarboxylate transporter substrate binding protein [Chloroflexi bacterium]|nr:MAG: tripartite tricarboxylate transporter substrate binding protein [Chloroflexota bacterium]
MRLSPFALLLATLVTITACGGTAAPSGSAPSAAASATPTSTELKKTASGYPARAISFVVPYAAGGGSDILIRSLDKISQDLKVFPQPFTISNVAGGSGFTGKQQALSKPADGYTLTIGDDSSIFGQLLGQAPMKYTEFTYVARLVTDPNMVVVRTESSLKTLKDWLDAARAKPKGVSVGGTGIGNADHVQLANIEKQAGASFNYVPFDSGGQVMTNLLGGKVDSAMANPSEAYEQMRAGKVRALGITTDKRISDLPDVPTLKEQGVDYVVAQFRGVAGPKGIPADVVAYLEEAFRRVAKSETWKTDYLAKYQQVDGYMGSAEFTAFMDVFFKEQEQAFKDLPSLKQ